jgi:hypothetical protein
MAFAGLGSAWWIGERLKTKSGFIVMDCMLTFCHLIASRKTVIPYLRNILIRKIYERINNYEELLAERKRIEHRIAFQKNVIQEELHELKSTLEPFLYLLPILNIFKEKPSGTLLAKIATSIGISVFGLKLLSKTNWFSHLLVPFVLKKASSLRVIKK